MNDREVLLLAYGAIKASSNNFSGLKSVEKLIEQHLLCSQLPEEQIDTSGWETVKAAKTVEHL